MRAIALPPLSTNWSMRSSSENMAVTANFLIFSRVMSSSPLGLAVFFFMCFLRLFSAVGCNFQLFLGWLGLRVDQPVGCHLGGNDACSQLSVYMYIYTCGRGFWDGRDSFG